MEAVAHGTRGGECDRGLRLAGEQGGFLILEPAEVTLKGLGRVWCVPRAALEKRGQDEHQPMNPRGLTPGEECTAVGPECRPHEASAGGQPANRAAGSGTDRGLRVRCPAAS
jgi:hypothetical protein